MLRCHIKELKSQFHQHQLERIYKWCKKECANKCLLYFNSNIISQKANYTLDYIYKLETAKKVTIPY